MTSGEIDLSALEIKTVSLDERSRMIDEARRAGQLTFRCAPLILGEQHLAINPDEATDVSLWFDEYVTGHDKENNKTETDKTYQILPITGLVRGLVYEGLFRRSSPFGRYAYHDESPGGIRHGDKIALRIPGGELLRSARTREIQSPLRPEHQTAAARLEPRTAYS